jgi:tetratricopeptide (TPR) repeat protein
MEMLMRLTPIAITAAMLLATVGTAGFGQRADDRIDARSMALTQQGMALVGQGRWLDAIDLFESALAVDARNRQAYIGLGRAAQGEKLPGKAVKFYGEALQLEPNDVEALAGQGEALVQRGAVDRAKANLARIRTLCKGACPQAQTLAAAIAKGPPAEVLASQKPDQGAPKPD